MGLLLVMGVFCLWIVLTPSHSWAELLIGVGVSFCALLMFGPMLGHHGRIWPRVSVSRIVSRFAYAILAFFVFLWEVAASAFRVSKIILGPQESVISAVFAFEVSLRSPVSVTVLSTMITLTPGTLAVDYIPDQRMLYIHSLRRQGEDIPSSTIRRFEDLVRRVAD